MESVEINNKNTNLSFFYKALAVGVCLFAIYFLVKIVYNMVIGIDMPNELLEPANIQLTQSIVDGKIPYSRDALVPIGERPGVSYEYPFITCLVAAGLSFIVNGNVVLAHYILSIISIVGTGVLGVLIVRKYSKTWVEPAFIFIILMFCHWRYGYISAAPDDFGLLISTLTLYLVTNEKIKNKPLIGAIGIVLCFYIKQYFITIAASIFVYMCLYRFKDAIKLFVYTIGLLFVTGALITIFWPLYWDYSVLFLIIYACSPDGSLASILYVLQQFGYLALAFAGLFAILIFALVKSLKAKKTQTAKKHLSVKENDALTLFIIQIPIQMICLFVIGTNDGAFLTYFLQLWVPSVAIVSVILIGMLLPEMDDTHRAKQWIYGIIYCLIIIFTLYIGRGKLPVHVLNEDDIYEWQQAYDIVSDYREKGQVTYARTLAFIGKSFGDDIYLTDHDGDISRKTYDVWLQTPWQQKLFPDAGLIYKENLAYRERLIEKARNHELSLITHVGNDDMAFTDDFLEDNGYTLLTTISLQTGNMDYDTEFWVVKE